MADPSETRMRTRLLIERLGIGELCDQYRDIDAQRSALIDQAPDDRSWTVEQADEIAGLADALGAIARDIADVFTAAAACDNEESR